MKFHVTLAVPWYNECFEEIVRSVATGLRHIGHEVTEKSGYGERHLYQDSSVKYAPDATNVVIGYYLHPDPDPEPPLGSILYQLEPVSLRTLHTSIPVQRMKNYIVWDYSRYNIVRLNEQGLRPIYVPAGSSPEMTTVPLVEPKDIDVLYYGGMHSRRIYILDEIKRRGLKVHATFNVWREERAALIARAKVILNLHGEDFYKTQESWRLVYPLSFGKAVVTEVNPGDDADGFSSAALCVPYQNLADACVYLVKNEERRHEIEIAAKRYMGTRQFVDGLKLALEETYGRNK